MNVQSVLFQRVEGKRDSSVIFHNQKAGFPLSGKIEHNLFLAPRHFGETLKQLMDLFKSVLKDVFCRPHAFYPRDAALPHFD